MAMGLTLFRQLVEHLWQVQASLAMATARPKGVRPVPVLQHTRYAGLIDVRMPTSLHAAFDAAISDGVHVLSVSLGGDPSHYFNDSIAIGSFHAVKNGIKVVCSAGNNGPTAGSVSNLAPWIFTVAASTMDREFPAYVSFGNTSLKGVSLSSTSLAQGKYPIILSTDARAANSTKNNAYYILLLQ
ncbi:Subtilisin-like protease SBT5.3 [Carex littledalei]|uniref:Subtilisin-like protease SBT5.3 n=1 Tax=Carex littledalei TaxID=544730 RepID=A0A833QHR1_9POAL|nr:Subtilisin-like protease SBT5.3 [Carex littledalei]